MSAPRTDPPGYPSRKQRGHQAMAISSRSIAALVPGPTVVVQPFGATAACAAEGGSVPAAAAALSFAAGD